MKHVANFTEYVDELAVLANRSLEGGSIALVGQPETAVVMTEDGPIDSAGDDLSYVCGWRDKDGAFRHVNDKETPEQITLALKRVYENRLKNAQEQMYKKLAENFAPGVLESALTVIAKGITPERVDGRVVAYGIKEEDKSRLAVASVRRDQSVYRLVAKMMGAFPVAVVFDGVITMADGKCYAVDSMEEIPFMLGAEDAFRIAISPRPDERVRLGYELLAALVEE